MEERQTNYTIAEGYRLPSGGLIYDVEVNPMVELRSMSARDEMKRQNPTTAQFKLLADIIEGCLIEKPKIHVYDMALGDYEYLLHRLRVVTYGDAYKIGLICPHCGEDIELDFHLDQIQIKDFDINKFNEFRNFTLPVSKKLITLKFSTPRLLDEIELKTKELRRKFPKADFNLETQVLLMTMIDSVDGEALSPTGMEVFINNLVAKDLLKITNNLDRLNQCLGLDNKILVDCPKCGGEVSTYFRFGSEFFRPTNI